MRIYIDHLTPVTLRDHYTCHGVPKEPFKRRQCSFTRIYTNRGIFIADETGLYLVGITDGKGVQHGGSIPITMDTSTVEYIAEQWQIPVPNVEVEISKVEYSLPNHPKTKLITEATDGSYVDCYFESTQDPSLVSVDITTFLSLLKFC